ncbi:hypothetical protein BAZSYMA_ACONTIG32555_1 [Bathymodiolus azoricus thioautotrophic gill symbiont]|uniref:Uncharacterized protein n=1 Tax=Bathymodiolus azoricus thioautotrophic gill symbiont TaxID=235205 RepID=A0A1H6MMX5_9GAMM|nr:hypothetical protein BAZSYMA_ACONTIG32555_1 [Bathymodiolus azoricus thioautotrophic gill symbiont]
MTAYSHLVTPSLLLAVLQWEQSLGIYFSATWKFLSFVLVRLRLSLPF